LEEAIGDFEQGFRLLAARQGLPHAHRWYYWQVIKFAVRSIWPLIKRPTYIDVLFRGIRKLSAFEPKHKINAIIRAYRVHIRGKLVLETVPKVGSMGVLAFNGNPRRTAIRQGGHCFEIRTSNTRRLTVEFVPSGSGMTVQK
jgi:hypothetical protein